MSIDFGIGPPSQGEVPPKRKGIDFGLGEPSDARSGSSPGLPVPAGLGITERITGGLLVGARRHFLLKPVIDRIAGAFPGVSTETLDRMEARLEHSRLSGAFEFVGEFGPDLAAGLGVFGLGRAAARQALAYAGRTATGARLLPATARTAARFSPQAAGGPMLSKPTLERGAEIAGGAGALGGYSGTAELAEGGSLDDAGRAALTTAALVGGLEVGMAAAFGRIARARQVDVGKVETLLERSQKTIMSEEAKVTTQIGRLNQRIEKVNNTVEQELELARTQLAAARAQPKPPGMAYQAGKGEMALERAMHKAEERANKFYEDMLPQWEQRVLRLEHKREVIKSFRAVNPGGAVYTRDQPFNPKDIRLMFSQMALKLMHTPESMRGKLGPSWARIYKQLDTAETMTMISRSHNEKVVGEWVQRAQKALGLSSRQVRKDRAIFLPLFSAWEKGGEQGVRQFMAQAGRARHTDEMLTMFREVDDAMSRIYQPLVEMGAEPALTEATLRGLGVQKYFPHLFDDLPEDQIMQKLAAKLGESRAAQMWDAYQREGLAKFSSIDFNRVRAGSLGEKIADKLPYDPNPFNSLFRYLNATHRRFEYGSRFGMAGEMKDVMVRAVNQEAARYGPKGEIIESGQGAATLASSILDTALNRTYYNQGMRQFSRIILGGQIASKLTLAVIPNLSQPVNMLAWGGARNLMRGFLKAVRGEEKDAILAATALNESVVHSVGRAFGESRIGPALLRGQPIERLAHAADKLAYWTLSGTGFSAVERWNRLWSGTASLHMFRDTLAKATAGRLRGNNLDIARRRFEYMGANLDDLVRKVRAGGDGYLASAEHRAVEVMATFKGAQTTQFIPSIGRRPLAWNHPLGRVFTQFKTFALGQGRLIRDQVFAEAARGNMKPLAYFLSAYPIAGEMVGNVRAVARGKPREEEGPARLVSNYTMVGGLGLFSDTITAARMGKLVESILGPTVGDFTQFAERMLQGDVEAVLKMAARQPAAQATRFLMAVGILTTQAMDDYLEEFPAFSGEGAEPTQAIDFGLARHREIMKKGQPR